MPRYVVDRTVEAVNKHGKSIVGATVLVMGLSYKPDIDDDRESPSFELIEMLQERGALVAYCDPFVPQARRGRKHDLGLQSIPCTAEAIGQYDAVVLSTPHTAFRDPALWSKVRLAVDTRNIVPRDLAGLDVVRA
jgi:UDP-N-acetyl-D-glucosamine dehydrogenase